MSAHAYQIQLRPAVEDDVPFLFELRRRTMEPHLIADAIAFDDAAHMTRIRYHWEDANIVLVDGEPLGLFKVHRDEEGLYLIQIQVDPSLQGKGVGQRLLKMLLEEADADQKEVRLYVLKGNPAKQLYERVGFVATLETDIEFLMRRAPVPQAQA